MDEGPVRRSIIARITDAIGTVLLFAATLLVGLVLLVFLLESHMFHKIPAPVEVVGGALAGSVSVWWIVRRVNRAAKRPPDPP